MNEKIHSLNEQYMVKNSRFQPQKFTARIHPVQRAWKNCTNQHDAFESVLHDPDIH